MSFSAAEKEIILHADGKKKHSPPNNGQTCRKDVLRLLKYDLFEFYANSRFAEENICSYYIKTIFLHLLDEQHETRHWANELLRCRYVDALSRIVRCLEKDHIEHYFIPGENILSEKFIPRSQLDAVKQYFSDKRCRYS